MLYKCVSKLNSFRNFYFNILKLFINMIFLQNINDMKGSFIVFSKERVPMFTARITQSYILGGTKAYLFRNQILFKTHLFPYAGMLLKSASLNCKWLRPLAGRHWNVNLFSIGVSCLVSSRHIDLLFGRRFEPLLIFYWRN